MGTSEEAGWVAVATRSELAEAGGMLEVEAGAEAVLLFDLGGTLYATGAICPHHAAFLAQGTVSGDCIDCPRHQGRFHIPTGRQLRGPACPPLSTYRVRMDEGRVLVVLTREDRPAALPGAPTVDGPSGAGLK
ncbi:MAG TPA: non-heme iron oxygenase ferredoxin subunit [Acidisphaera sp.]|nr:non-heme iron oxygenase ferredoxin subunit [Acidisphaera sp.]